MTSKYTRPTGAYAGQVGLGNATKYQDDSAATPRRPISSAKIDGDMNYVVDALNDIDNASGSRASIAERLNVSLNADGSLKVSVAGALDEFTTLGGPSALQRIDNSTVRLVGGDYRNLFGLNRRVQVTAGGVPLVGDVASTSFSGGNTVVELVDVVDASGALAVIGSDPTSIAYGPLSMGAHGNAPRSSDVFKIAGFKFADASGDLGIIAPGGSSPAAWVTAGGLRGVASQSVDTAALTNAVLAMLVPTGVVAPFAGATAPTGWLMCYGQVVSRSTYGALFTAVGTTYGSGDGSTTFNLPDLRGRGVFGVDSMGGSAAGRVTSGNSGITGTALGAAGGDERLHQHNHAITDPGHTHTVTHAIAVQGSGGGSGWLNGTGATVTSNSATTDITLADAGSGGSQNMPPALMLNYIIKV
jgi:microcystin-dependent protein